MRPARVSGVPGSASTTMCSKPLPRRQKSVTTSECPPMVDATTGCAPNQAWASASASGALASDRSAMTSLMAAKVRPGMPASQSGATRSGRPSSVGAPAAASAGSGCTTE